MRNCHRPYITSLIGCVQAAIGKIFAPVGFRNQGHQRQVAVAPTYSGKLPRPFPDPRGTRRLPGRRHRFSDNCGCHRGDLQEYGAAEVTAATRESARSASGIATAFVGLASVRNAPLPHSLTDLPEAEVGKFAGVFTDSHEIPCVEAGKFLCFRLAESYRRAS